MDEIVTTYYKKHIRYLQVGTRIKAYIQVKVFYKVCECVLLDDRRKGEDGVSIREGMALVSKDMLATTIESVLY